MLTIDEYFFIKKKLKVSLILLHNNNNAKNDNLLFFKLKLCTYLHFCENIFRKIFLIYIVEKFLCWTILNFFIVKRYCIEMAFSVKYKYFIWLK